MKRKRNVIPTENAKNKTQSVENKENLKKGILQILVKEDFWQKNKFATKVLGQMLPIRLTDNE